MIDATRYSDEDLQNFDRMMVEVVVRIERISALAVGMWSEVLKELDLRGKVKLLSGSYDNVGGAKIQRLWQADEDL